MQIVFNNKTYNSIEEMPANERQAFERMQQIFVDANGNGIPDFMEGDMAQKVMTAVTSNVNFNGKAYTNLDELPPDAKEKVQKAFDVMQRLGLVPANMSQGFTSTPSTPPASFEPAFQPSKPLLSQEPTIQESGGNRWMLIVGFMATLLFCAVGVAVAIYLLR